MPNSQRGEGASRTAALEPLAGPDVPFGTAAYQARLRGEAELSRRGERGEALDWVAELRNAHSRAERYAVI
ncbi:hypothetical protein, partial [Streptacidiphilus anmyonensis]|uniref:hypothetical protein n=1 Tax=Streptacidiphilus anmyonensis TaxID=405782 RepID=UPI0005A84D55